MTPHYVAFEITPGWHQGVIVVEGPNRERRAAALWNRCATASGAAFRAITSEGEEFGTLKPGERHGVGCFTERCADCEKEFKTPTVGESICPGCTVAHGPNDDRRIA
jgi:hypothetical protein